MQICQREMFSTNSLAVGEDRNVRVLHSVRLVWQGSECIEIRYNFTNQNDVTTANAAIYHSR